MPVVAVACVDDALRESNGILRFTELTERVPLDRAGVECRIRDLEREGAVETFTVADHVMIRTPKATTWTGGD